MRTITGKELDKAILKSQGRTWDGIPIPKLKVTDLRRDAIDLLKEKAIRRGRQTGSYIKIGYFGDSDADLKYQDEIHGSLITLSRSVCTKTRYISGMTVRCH